jgi:hypothetical protein
MPWRRCFVVPEGPLRGPVAGGRQRICCAQRGLQRLSGELGQRQRQCAALQQRARGERHGVVFVCRGKHRVACRVARAERSLQLAQAKREQHVGHRRHRQRGRDFGRARHR